MADRSVPRAVLPVGFERFHRRAFVNYQLNRAYALGSLIATSCPVRPRT